MRIGELAELVKCEVGTIRYYERLGLLGIPPRTTSGYRRFCLQHVDELAFIRNCRNVGMTLAEVKQLMKLKSMPEKACDAVVRLLDEHIADVSEQIVAMESLRSQLEELRQACGLDHHVKDCGILHGLSEMGKKNSAACPEAKHQWKAAPSARV